jgi:uncharacterized protein
VGWLGLPATLLLLASAPTRAGGDAGSPGASVDCTKASTRIEKMICSDDESAALDGQLAETYRRALADPAENPDEIRIEQHAWLSDKRNKCGDVTDETVRYVAVIKPIPSPRTDVEYFSRSWPRFPT